MADEWSISWHHEALKIPDIWSQNNFGGGITIAVLDTGVAAPAGLDNPDFEYCSANGTRIGAMDPNGHGTCCGSTIASYLGGSLGIAPYAKLVSFRMLGTGVPGDVLSAFKVHHIFPFHYCIALGRPDLELDQRNLITLCEDEEGKPGENHHLLVGHLDDFQSSNLSVVEDAKGTFHGMTATEIRASVKWEAKVKTRLLPLDKMTAAGKQAFRDAMNERFPLETKAPGQPSA